MDIIINFKWVTVVDQWTKAPGIHCYVEGSMPAVTPRNCTKKKDNALWSTKKTKEEKIINFKFFLYFHPIVLCLCLFLPSHVFVNVILFNHSLFIQHVHFSHF